MRRTPRQARFLGLWTASWLFALLLFLLLRLGDLAVQWPVLLIPVLWALIALRPRRGAEPAVERRRPSRPPAPERGPAPPAWQDDDGYDRFERDRSERDPYVDHFQDDRLDDDRLDDDEPGWPPEPPRRRPPPTLEMPWRPEPPRDRREE